VDNLIFFIGIACSVSGVGVLFFQGIKYLSTNTWEPLSLIFLLEKGPASLLEMVESSDQVYNAFDACPLFLFLFFLGLLIMFIGSRFGARYSG